MLVWTSKTSEGDADVQDDARDRLVPDRYGRPRGGETLLQHGFRLDLRAAGGRGRAVPRHHDAGQRLDPRRAAGDRREGPEPRDLLRGGRGRGGHLRVGGDGRRQGGGTAERGGRRADLRAPDRPVGQRTGGVLAAEGSGRLNDRGFRGEGAGGHVEGRRHPHGYGQLPGPVTDRQPTEHRYAEVAQPFGENVRDGHRPTVGPPGELAQRNSGKSVEDAGTA